MKVFVVVECVAYDSSEVKAVFGSRDKAEEFCKEQRPLKWVDYSIEEHEIL